MTKQTPNETALKCQLTIEEANKIVESNAIVVCHPQTSPKLEEKIEAPPIRTRIKSKKNRLGKIMPELYDLENCVESEKPVIIDLDLDLYQMEKL